MSCVGPVTRQLTVGATVFQPLKLSFVTVVRTPTSEERCPLVRPRCPKVGPRSHGHSK
ncbi:hypothetical protein P879_10537 [Paragonimus westermani]|uniref:Uncharacterized protein n=1 Tax=Paragonimus westermani TaxID=34504 RepID=A0A8T0D671_9TREM|nr:hypothetical protein P879_10537 [Paragonimus westermani]